MTTGQGASPIGLGGWNPALDAATQALTQWTRALERWRTFEEAVEPAGGRQPHWATAHEVVDINDSVGLRRFGDVASRGLPALIVTPQVNHSYVADFSDKQSLVRTLLGAGVHEVGVTDWLPPPERRYAIADSLDDITACIDHLGGRAHLVGLCQGGWQSAMVAALHPDKVASLTVAAAPIDAHAGATLLHAWVFGLPMSFFEGVVLLGGGVAPGRKLSEGFDLLKPFERLVFGYAGLWLNADDPEYVRRFTALRNWYKLNKDVAGDLYLEAVRDLFKDNRLARGTFEVRGRRVDLASIRCPLNLVAGARDHITPPAQVLAFEKLAPQSPCKSWLVDAGHIGSFMGGGALKTAWTEIGARLCEIG
jgi:poly(3-hydroxyalkanoate) synthetase